MHLESKGRFHFCLGLFPITSFYPFIGLGGRGGGVVSFVQEWIFFKANCLLWKQNKNLCGLSLQLSGHIVWEPKKFNLKVPLLYRNPKNVNPTTTLPLSKVF